MSKILSEFVVSREFESMRTLFSDLGMETLPNAYVRTMHALLRGREQIPLTTYDFWNRGTCYTVNRFAFESLFETIMRYGDNEGLSGDGPLGRLAAYMALTMIPSKVGAAIRRLSNGKISMHPNKVAEIQELTLGTAFSASPTSLMFPKKVSDTGRQARIDGKVYNFFSVYFYGSDAEYITPVLQTRIAKFDTSNFDGWWYVLPIGKEMRNGIPPVTRGHFKYSKLVRIRPGRSNLLNFAARRNVEGYLEETQGRRLGIEKSSVITEDRDSRNSRKTIRERKFSKRVDIGEDGSVTDGENVSILQYVDGDNTTHQMADLAWFVYKKHAPFNPLVAAVIHAELEQGCEDITDEHRVARFNEIWTKHGHSPIENRFAYYRRRIEAMDEVFKWMVTHKFDLS